VSSYNERGQDVGEWAGAHTGFGGCKRYTTAEFNALGGLYVYRPFAMAGDQTRVDWQKVGRALEAVHTYYSSDSDRTDAAWLRIIRNDLGFEEPAIPRFAGRGRFATAQRNVASSR